MNIASEIELGTRVAEWSDATSLPPEARDRSYLTEAEMVWFYATQARISALRQVELFEQKPIDIDTLIPPVVVEYHPPEPRRAKEVLVDGLWSIGLGIIELGVGLAWLLLVLIAFILSAVLISLPFLP